MTRVLVAGGTGRLGTRVVGALAARGVEVRVLTRDPQRAAHLTGSNVEIVTGDVRDPARTTGVVAGADVVVSAVHGFAGAGRVSPATVDRDGNAHLIDAASTSGAEVVLMSIVGAAADSPMELFHRRLNFCLQPASNRHRMIRDLSFSHAGQFEHHEFFLAGRDGGYRRAFGGNGSGG